MTDEIAGFVGDLDLAQVDLDAVKTFYPEWHDKAASSKRGAFRTVSLD